MYCIWRVATIVMVVALASLAAMAVMPLLEVHNAFAFLPVSLILGNASDLDPNDDLVLMELSTPVLLDLDGQPAPYAPKAGEQRMIAVDIKNNDNIRDWSSVVIIEVRDSNGITISAAWQSHIVKAAGTASVGTSWTPEHEGNYLLRAFAVSNIEKPRIFSLIASKEVAVSANPPAGPDA